jgi:lysophospholipid acyltransferase (LPLAT)-like uncharacterized protein
MHLPRPLTNFLIRTAGRTVLGLWCRTERVTVVGKDAYDRLRSEKKPVVLLLWHGRLFFAPFFFRNTGIVPLISPSRDGEALVQLAAGWGYKVLRGSSSHSIVKAWKEMKAELSAGGVLVIVPDGPRGPRHTLKAGGLRLAQESGATCVPVTFSARRKKILSSWDRFMLPRPFTRVVALFGEPFGVDPRLKGEAFERERLRIERELAALDDRADASFDEP